MKQFFVYTLLLLNLVAATALVLATVSVFLSPEKLWVAAVFGLAYPYLLVINLVFMVLWVIIKPKFTLLSLLVILTGYNHIGNYLQFSGKQTQEKGIRIISYNVKYFMGNSNFPNKENADHILNYLRENNADIICLQEVKLNKRQIFDIGDSKLPQISHMQLAHTSNAGGQLTLTRFPILNMGEIRFENSGNMIIYTDLLMNSDTVRVYNCHLQSYRLLPKDINSIDSLDFENNEKNKMKIKELGLKFRDALIKRAEQAATLREHLNQCPYPVIVCGDFNDTPVSFTYHTVRGDLEDSFTQSGKGTASTYNGKLPSFRIDYILYSPKFTSYNFEVSTLNHSDHYPISCDLFPAEK
ncbi:MAG TPA: endonuclease/exonuclease/phosphatase family protein [Prolixibacteraceae bacterium]|nr:endonuclease/exonuclease/phosphatase family protein [Prolixibacteraceae bacterium]